jgi:hypothetical protein
VRAQSEALSGFCLIPTEPQFSADPGFSESERSFVSIREVAWAKFVVVVLHPITQIKVESGPMNSFVRVRKAALQIDTASVCNVPGKRCPVQTVDATPFDQLIRQHFPRATDPLGCGRSKPSQGGVPTE